MIAAVLGPLGVPELIIILVIVLLIFGVGRLSDVGGALGKSIREFRRAAQEPDEPEEDTKQQATIQEPPAERTCGNCNAKLNPESKFCAQCGAPTQAAVG